MGQFFTVHSVDEWVGAVAETMEPSIWTNVAFSPLSRSQRMLFERPGRVYYSFPRGMREGNDIVQVSAVADVSLLVAVHETVGRFYAGLVFHALSPTSPHIYHRLREEATLKLKEPEQQQQEGGARASSSLELRGGSLTTRSPTPGGGLSLAELGQEGPFQESTWPYLLVYCVKEGILVHYAETMEDCEAVVCDIAASYGVPTSSSGQQQRSAAPSPTRQLDEAIPTGAEGGSGTSNGGGTSVLANAKVRSAVHAVGRAPGVATRLLTEILTVDLQRTFAVRCKPEDQGDFTNCVVFCMRMLSKMQLAVRGFDLRRVCESTPHLGTMAGEAASESWEQLWKIVRD